MDNTPITTEHLWNVLSTRLRAFLLARVSNEQVAEDLLQDTFVRIHKKIGTIQDEERLTSWVFQIARNLVVDYYRANARITARQTSDLESNPEQDTESNLNELVSGWLPDMVGELPDNYREAVRLYELEGVPQQEIADRLGISLSGAKSRVQRGREKLKSMLFDCCSVERDRRGNVIEYVQNDEKSCGCDDSCAS